jgi:hypothetical protein
MSNKIILGIASAISITLWMMFVPHSIIVYSRAALGL